MSSRAMCGKTYRQDILNVLHLLPVVLRKLEGAPWNLLCDSSVCAHSGYRAEHSISGCEKEIDGLKKVTCVSASCQGNALVRAHQTQMVGTAQHIVS